MPYQQLPFSANDMDFLRWFKSLTLKDDIKSCELLLRILLTLNTIQAPGKTKLLILEKLTPALFQLTARLTSQPTANDSIFFANNTDENDNSVFEIAIWSCAALANAYKHLSLEDTYKKHTYYSQQQKSLLITHGLQALNRALLYISQTYNQPYKNFWADCFHFYLLTHPNDPLKKHENDAIIHAFKHLLVFYLSHTNQFSPQEMRTIFTLLGQYSVHAKLLKEVPEKKFKGIPYIHLQRNLPPSIPPDNLDKNDHNILHIATVDVSSKLLEAAYDKELKHSYIDQLMLVRLTKTLIANTERKHERVPTNAQCPIVTDFDQLIDCLRIQEVDDINAIKSRIFLHAQHSTKIKPLIVKNLEDTPLPPILDAPYTANNNAQLLDRSKSGYSLLWPDNQGKPKVGNIIGLQQKKMNIGFIRWLSQAEASHIVLGVELLSDNAQAIKISNAETPDTEIDAIYLPSEESNQQPESVLVLNNGFHPDKFIFIKKEYGNSRYQQMQQLQSTLFLNRYQIAKAY